MNGTGISWALLITVLVAPILVSILGEIFKYKLNVRLSKLEVRNHARMRLQESCETLLKIAIAAGPKKQINPDYEFQQALHTIAIFGDEESSDYAIDLLNGQHRNRNDVQNISELLSRTHKDIRSSFGIKVKVRSNSIRFNGSASRGSANHADNK